jgi:GIY-YIG catalytic domain.
MLKGIIQSLDDVDRLKNLASVLLNHHCERSTKLCKRILSDRREVCRRPHYANLNPSINSYGYVPIPIQFDAEAEKILLKLGMLKIDPLHNNKVVPNDPRLEAGIHVYPTNHDFHFSPVNPTLFAIFQSTQNLQICDKSLAARYLTNYTSRVDTRTRAVFSSNQQTGSIQVDVMDIPTTKLAFNRIHEIKAKQGNRIKDKPQGVLISLPEMYRRIFNKKQIICTETFTSFPTLPLEERIGLFKQSKIHFTNANDCVNFVYEHQPLAGFAQIQRISSIETRQTILQLPRERQFTWSQELLIRDQYCSPVTIDNITAHGIRPPELYQFDYPQHYVQYFYWKHPSVREKTLSSGRRVSVTEQLVSQDIVSSAWIDGMERQVFVRKAAIDVILSTYNSKLPSEMLFLFHILYLQCYNDFHATATPEIMHRVRVRMSSQHHKSIVTVFLTNDDRDVKLPLPVIVPVKPNRPQKFLISLILSLGRFHNEIELWNAGSLNEVFYNASLIPVHPSIRFPTCEEIERVLKMYVDQYLLYIPASWHTLNKYLIMAQTILNDAFYFNAVSDLGIPANTYSSLYQVVTEECQAYIQELKTTLIKTLTATIPNAPTIEQLMTATKEKPLQWEPTFIQLEGQSDESHYEQQRAFNFIRKKIDAYCKCERIARRGTILHGHAGSGKTTIQAYVILYELSRGLLSTSTALASKRSRENGGIHIHQLLKIVNLKHATTTEQYSTDKMIDRLWKHPEVVNYLRAMDCLNLDEGGQTDAELFTVIDNALRYIRNSSDYLGGILSTITIDINQCGTMNNTRPLWCSPNIITSYDVIELQGFVRSCQDNPQQELILISEKTVRSVEDKQRFHEIITSHCQCYSSWNNANISPDMLRIFGKRAAVNNHEKEFIDKHIRPNNVSVVVRKAEDEECIRSLYNQWTAATPKTSTKLNATVKEQSSLLLYYNAVVELTYNKKNHWDQGQVAIIRSHVSQQEIDHWTPILIAIAKIGTNAIPPNLEIISDNDLCQMGWTFEHVTKYQTQEQTISLEVLGRRTQYPFRSRNASTIHKVMGSTLHKGITQVSNDPSSDYYIWEKGLVVVLLTRFRQLSHLAFVDPLGMKHTTDVLLEILDKVPPYYYHSKHVLDKVKKTFPLEHNDNTTVREEENIYTRASITTPPATIIPEINLNTFPYHPKDYPISSAHATPHGFLYMLLSLADRRSFYIGQTTNLRKRLHAHNNLISASGADPRYRPWVPLIYFTGFQSAKQRRSMEHKWQNERNRLMLHHSNTSITDVINIGIRLCSTYMSNNTENHDSTCRPSLVLHQCYSTYTPQQMP